MQVRQKKRDAFILPHTAYILHCKAGYTDTDPAYEAQQNRLSSVTHQLGKICIESDGTHSHNDEKFT